MRFHIRVRARIGSESCSHRFRVFVLREDGELIRRWEPNQGQFDLQREIIQHLLRFLVPREAERYSDRELNDPAAHRWISVRYTYPSRLRIRRSRRRSWDD